MKKIIIISAIIAVYCLAVPSCSTRLEMANYGTDADALKFYIMPMDGIEFAVNDQVNITCASGTLPYVLKSSLEWEPKSNAYFRHGSRTSELTFYAVHPAVSNVSYVNFLVPKSQSSPEELRQANFARGYAAHPQGSEVLITVTHLMSKVKFNIKGLADGERIQAFKAGSYTGIVDTLKYNSTAIDINPCCTIPAGGIKGGNGCTYEAYVCPGKASTSVKLFSYTYNGTSFTKKGFEAREPGKTYEYDITITPSGYTVKEVK